MKTEASNIQISPGKLAATLIVTALCSLSLPFGFSLFAASALQNFLNPSPSPSEQGDFMALLGLAAIIAGPLVFGLFLKPDWSGLVIGISGLIGEVGGSLFSALVGPLLNPLSSLFGGLPFIFPALGAITGMLWTAGKLKTTEERNGLRQGILIGIGVFVVLSLLIIISRALGGMNQGTAENLTFFLTFPSIWLSVVFFHEFFSHRTDQQGLLI